MRTYRMQRTGEMLWRCGQPAVTTDQIAGQLRTDRRFVTDHQWMLAKGATGAVELEVKIALVPQIRVFRMNRFPMAQERRRSGMRIKLDWRSAWNLNTWQAFHAAAAVDTAPEWMVACRDEILATGFVADERPVLFTHSGCCGDEPTLLDPESYRLTNSEQGDFLCPESGCCSWPCMTCRCDGCEGVAITYVAGFWDPCQLLARYPTLTHNVLASFAWLHEQPELQNQQNTQEGYHRVLKPMLSKMRWTL